MRRSDDADGLRHRSRYTHALAGVPCFGAHQLGPKQRELRIPLPRASTDVHALGAHRHARHA
jgi:hypothetical protein